MLARVIEIATRGFVSDSWAFLFFYLGHFKIFVVLIMMNIAASVAAVSAGTANKRAAWGK